MLAAEDCLNVSGYGNVCSEADNWEIGEVELLQGWNLVQGLVSENQILSPSNFMGSKGIVVIYVFSPLEQKFIRTYPKPESDKLGASNFSVSAALGQYASWVYAANPRTLLRYKIKKPLSLDQRGLVPGWNFIAVTKDMFKGNFVPNGPGYEGEYFSWAEVKGTCGLNNPYWWNPESQSWATLAVQEKVKGYDFDEFWRRGLVVKSSRVCRLSNPVGSESTLPSLPTLPN